MVRNILIISSEYTGHGHKSITEALSEQFANYPDVKVHVVDGFSLAGNFGIKFGKLYGSVTRNAKDLWKLAWEIALKKPALLNEFTELAIRDKFLKLVKRLQPDLILSVHPNFNGSVLNILEEHNINIPFLILIADLVSISPLWADPRADYIICPTEESKLKCLEFGIPESKTIVLGFPVRAKFCTDDESIFSDRDFKGNRPLECLIMSGGEGSGNMTETAQVLLDNFDCRVSIITGRNKALKAKLENNLKEKYGQRVKIYGFVDNVQDLMRSSDIAFTRGSPNTMMEAVMCNVPLVITGALPGQEEGNPGYLLKHNLGVVCTEPQRLRSVVTDLLADNAKKLNQIRKSQREFRNPNIARNIVDFILSVEKTRKAVIPDIDHKPGKIEKLKATIIGRK